VGDAPRAPAGILAAALASGASSGGGGGVGAEGGADVAATSAAALAAGLWSRLVGGASNAVAGGAAGDATLGAKFSPAAANSAAEGDVEAGRPALVEGRRSSGLVAAEPNLVARWASLAQGGGRATPARIAAPNASIVALLSAVVDDCLECWGHTQ
jgi:hypothetical protein